MRVALSFRNAPSMALVTATEFCFCAPHGHAEMSGFDDHAHSQGLHESFQGLGDLGGESFLDLAARMRDAVPDLALTTDIICGFPTETPEDYLQTEDAVRTVAFESAFIFKYSVRKGTVAARRFEDDVSEEEKSHRVTRLVDIQREISRSKNEARIGLIERVLVEGVSRKDPGAWRARNQGNTIVPEGERFEYADIDQFPPGAPGLECKYCMYWWADGITAELPELE